MRAIFVLLLALVSTARAGDASLSQPSIFSGMCDASAAVAVGTNLFLVASDEDNSLRLYRADQPGAPIKQFDCNTFLQLHGKSLEADLEGGALIGNRAFWIGSHGRNKDGKLRPNRCRLFATDIRTANGDVQVIPTGRPYKTLLEDLSRDGRFSSFHLADAATRAPKEADALNIEGLSATPDGHLLIGFRNPIPGGKALLIPLLNPNAVIDGSVAKFGDPVQIDLGGLGIRDIAYSNGNYFIIAGAYHSGGSFRFYVWSGKSSEAPTLMKVTHPHEYTPEAIVIYPEKGFKQVQILSDDGTRMVDGIPCKDCPEESRRTFRSFWLNN